MKIESWSTPEKPLPAPGARWFRIRQTLKAAGKRWLDLFKTNHCPTLLPWFRFPDSSGDMNQIHRIAMEFEWKQSITPLQMAKRIFATIAWPLFAILHSVVKVSVHGPTVKEQYGISVGMQLRDLIRLSNRCNIAPSSFYKFRLFLSENQSKALLYVQSHEIFRLMTGLNQGLDVGLFDDKQRFYEHCLKHQIRTTPVIAAFRGGAVACWYEGVEGVLPEEDLFFKPVDLYCGIGIERWNYTSGSQTWRFGKKDFDTPSFLAYCRQRSLDRAYIVQSRIRGSEFSSRLAVNGICTVRVVTARCGEEEPILLIASLRMPTGTAYVDNFAAGGIAAPVNLCDGKVSGPAVGKNVKLGIWRSHPDTRHPIEGVSVPAWEQTADLCVGAHRTIPRVAFIGWDVALSAEGPVLLEANPNWCVDLVQMPGCRPLGETVFARYYLHQYRPSLTVPSTGMMNI